MRLPPSIIAINRKRAKKGAIMTERHRFYRQK
jgi:hypothetical protein